MKTSKYSYQSSHTVQEKPFRVYWTKAADKALQKRQQPLIVEMELKFACMVRMLVHFHDQIEDVVQTRISDKLSVFYRPVMGQRCTAGEPPDNIDGNMAMGTLTTGPMARRFPKQLGINFVRGEWVGEYA
jgi:hypothetical protein